MISLYIVDKHGDTDYIGHLNDIEEPVIERAGQYMSFRVNGASFICEHVRLEHLDRLGEHGMVMYIYP